MGALWFFSLRSMYRGLLENLCRANFANTNKHIVDARSLPQERVEIKRSVYSHCLIMLTLGSRCFVYSMRHTGLGGDIDCFADDWQSFLKQCSHWRGSRGLPSGWVDVSFYY